MNMLITACIRKKE